MNHTRRLSHVAAMAALLLAVSAAILPASPVFAGGPITTTYPGADCPLKFGLQSCINAVEAGSTIHIAAETVDEDITIRKSLILDAAKARYELAAINYQASARKAVREVEEALVNLDSTAARRDDARTALDGYRTAFVATEERYKNGLASLLELEDARRTRLAGKNAVVSLQRERSAAWVALYRAAGGGWTAASARH